MPQPEPKVGQTLKNHKGVLIIGGLVAAGFVWYSYHSASQAANNSSSTTASTSSSTDPNASSSSYNDPNSYVYDPSQMPYYDSGYAPAYNPNAYQGWAYVPQPTRNPTKNPHKHVVHAHDGFYRLLPSGALFQVRGNTRYKLSRATWNALKKQHKNKIIVKPIIKSDPVMALPFGGIV